RQRTGRVGKCNSLHIMSRDEQGDEQDHEQGHRSRTIRKDGAIACLARVFGPRVTSVTVTSDCDLLRFLYLLFGTHREENLRKKIDRKDRNDAVRAILSGSSALLGWPSARDAGARRGCNDRIWPQDFATNHAPVSRPREEDEPLRSRKSDC